MGPNQGPVGDGPARTGPLGTEFCLPSRLACHPTAWLVTINGLLYDARILPVEIQAECARRGLIPAVLPPSAPTPPGPQ
jgi:hypothetical protein